MNTRWIVSSCIMAALVFACGPRSRTAAVPAPAVSGLATAEGSTAAMITAAPAESNDETITSQFDVAAVKGRVEFALGVTNAGKKRVEVNFAGGQRYDFVVLDSLGREVWRWGSGRLFTQSVQNKLLGGGDSMRIDERWTTARPGKYVAIATLKSTNFPVERRVEFELR
ncbi:MAG TPA: BsuPI-related putative proteinase inhibitor [Gemmatimonadaceae bacterium]|nr:BsuPI-related putative proteinase inhibitor [Gemmatimonadaceae bacterium]